MIGNFYRERLIVTRQRNFGNRATLSVFLGLFNAEEYLDGVLNDLRSQTEEVDILIVDNASTDATWSKIQDWLDLFPGRLTLVRNPINIGGGGSLLRNLDLVNSEWFVTWHQDDHYYADHLEILSYAALASEEDVVCVATDMGRLREAGETAQSPIRASWFLPDYEPATVFLTNMRLHNFPFPAAAFRTKEFQTYAAPWHSAAFPDTEWVLNASADLKRVKYVDRVSMEYRENPSSESHSLTSKEQNIGSFMALSRVFNSPRFVKLCRSIPEQDRGRFATYLMNSLDIRVKNTKSNSILKLMANEQMAHAWDYSEISTVSGIQEAYAGISGNSVTDLTARILGGSAIHRSETHSERHRIAFAWMDGDDLGIQQSKASTWIYSIAGIIPASLLRRILKSLGWLLPVGPKHAWRTRWK